MPLTPDTIHGLAGLAAREALASTVNNGCSSVRDGSGIQLSASGLERA